MPVTFLTDDYFTHYDQNAGNLTSEHMLGRCPFEVNADVAAGMLRPLRNLDSTDSLERGSNCALDS